MVKVNFETPEPDEIFYGVLLKCTENGGGLPTKCVQWGDSDSWLAGVTSVPLQPGGEGEGGGEFKCPQGIT